MKHWEIFVNEEFCKGCGICVHFCPRQAIRLSGEFNSKGVNAPVPAQMEKCSGCRTCELYCPDFAIAVDEADEGTGPAEEKKGCLSREGERPRID